MKKAHQLVKAGGLMGSGADVPALDGSCISLRGLGCLA